jgi:hypothetical protein
MILTALFLRASPQVVAKSGMKTLRQLRMPALTVGLIVALAYLYNYSGMAYTLGDFLAGLGKLFPLVSGFLGWIACFLSGSDPDWGESYLAGCHEFFRGRNWKDDLPAEYCCRSYNCRPGGA